MCFLLYFHFQVIDIFALSIPDLATLPANQYRTRSRNSSASRKSYTESASASDADSDEQEAVPSESEYVFAAILLRLSC